MMALRRAVQICGGLDALGDALNTSTESLQRMIAGVDEVPLPLSRRPLACSSKRPRRARRSERRTQRRRSQGPRHGAEALKAQIDAVLLKLPG